MAHEVSSVGFGLVHPSPMDLEASQSPEVSARCGPHSCPFHPSLLPLWQVRMGLPGTSWMGMARFVAFSVEQEAFPSLSLSLFPNAALQIPSTAGLERLPAPCFGGRLSLANTVA